MLFSSSVFFMAFLPLVLICYFLIPSKFLWARNTVLLIFSLIFYGWGEPKYILVMAFSIVFNYCLGLLLGKSKEAEKKSAKAILIINIVGNLGILSFFKYSDFLIDTINQVIGGSISLLNIALPIGISFYTFQTMSYIIDVYWGRVKYQKNFIAFACYVTLFPQLIAGPIVRYKDVEGMLLFRESTEERVALGLKRFIIGFAKKVLLANQIYVIYNQAMASNEPSLLLTWLGAIAFTFQIYFDFSGYSDMAIGLGKIFGFDYLENFNYPYISKSITEFWRRWHMSLSTWFKEYVYIPLGGNKKGIIRQLFNIAIVWTLTGLWHGASWNFVLWGAYFGLILILEKAFMLRVLKRLPGFICHIYSLVLIVLGWVLFSTEDLHMVAQYLMQMFNFKGSICGDLFLYLVKTRWILIVICILGSTPLPKKLWSFMTSKLGKDSLVIGIIETIFLLGIMCLSIAFLVSGSYNPFLYFRF